MVDSWLYPLEIGRKPHERQACNTWHPTHFLRGGADGNVCLTSINGTSELLFEPDFGEMSLAFKIAFLPNSGKDGAEAMEGEMRWRLSIPVKAEIK